MHRDEIELLSMSMELPSMKRRRKKMNDGDAQRQMKHSAFDDTIKTLDRVTDVIEDLISIVSGAPRDEKTKAEISKCPSLQEFLEKGPDRIEGIREYQIDALGKLKQLIF